MPFSKGQKQSNTGRTWFKKGHIAWNKDIPLSDICKKDLSESRKGKHFSPKTEFKKGFVPFNKGKKLSPEHIQHLKGKRPNAYGEKNHFWKGGITSKNQEIRSSFEIKLWREAVFTRDNYTCQKCQQRGGRLHAHHIFNFATYLDLRFAIDNGICFCKKCHKLFHHIYGIKNNTKQQLNKFLS